MNKDTKILIPEIPGEWTERVRSGHRNTWNHQWPTGTPHRNGLPEVSLEPPEKGLFAERIDGAWYWVCGCERCLGSTERSYIVCYEHDRCRRCRTHNTALGPEVARWGHAEGFTCGPCQEAEDKAIRDAALAHAREIGHSEEDCQFTDDITCPHCASKLSSDGIQRDRDGMDCDVCGGKFDLQLHFEVTYTTTIPRSRT